MPRNIWWWADAAVVVIRVVIWLVYGLSWLVRAAVAFALVYAALCCMAWYIGGVPVAFFGG